MHDPDTNPLTSASYPGSFLLGEKDPGRRWSRDLLKSSRFLINYELTI